ncbi:MAG TPA: dockerin type I domain-containing protein [Clostridia bacterium]
MNAKVLFFKVTLVSVVVMLLISSAITVNASSGCIPLGELLEKTNFTDGVANPWNVLGDTDNGFSNGCYIITIKNPGASRLDSQLRYSQKIKLELDHEYRFKFKVTADKNCSIYAKVGDRKDPYWEFYSNNWNPIPMKANIPLEADIIFRNDKKDQSDAEIAFMMGNGCGFAGTTYSFEYVSFSDIFNNYLKGDVNNDGKLNSMDMSSLKRSVLGIFTSTFNAINADMNKDGNINSTDYSLLKRAVLSAAPTPAVDVTATTLPEAALFLFKIP